MGSGASNNILNVVPIDNQNTSSINTSNHSKGNSPSKSLRDTSPRHPVLPAGLSGDEADDEIEHLLQETRRKFDDKNVSFARKSLETEELSLSFESFLHRDGTLYTCFTQDGATFYFDDQKGLIPFPQEMYSQGRFISGYNEATINSGSKENASVSGPYYDDSERSSQCYIPGRGMVMTYIFEGRTNVCKYFDDNSGAWLILPLDWEMNLNFVKQRIQQVKSALPVITDYKEVAAALRQCNYDPDEVISVFLAIFGDSLENSFQRQQHFEDPLLQRDLWEKERKIECLQHALQETEKDIKNFQVKCKHLQEENDSLNRMIDSLNDRVIKLEAEHDKNLDIISTLQKVPVIHPDPTPLPVPIPPKHLLEPRKVTSLLRVARDLNICNQHLKVSVGRHLSDLSRRMNDLGNTVLKMKDFELGAAKETEELRALYQREALERKLLYNQLQELRGNIRVFCRCRLDTQSQNCLEFPSDDEIQVNQNGSRKKFFFDKVFSPQSTQEDVFIETHPIIKSCADGYNVSILAYGQTGSGKTYTMMGTQEKPGVNIRSIRALLHICHERETIKYTIKVSMLEIYNETVKDLLSKNIGDLLELRTQGKTVTVPGLTEIEVATEADIREIMALGEKNRTVASTKMNTESSRSHLMVMLRVSGMDSISGVASFGTLTLCDLAGSERISKTEATGQRLVEAAAINKSLTSLGQVFTALKTNALHVPYRNSKLTHLLQPSLSGNAKACVFVTVSPDVKNLGETLSSLLFGSSIQQIALGKAAPQITSTRAAK
ncbi:uncharacterized protein LOC144770857 [Lissotriton helveticus]